MRLESQVQYWKGRLAGAPPSLELPTDRARPAEPSFKGETVPVAVSAELSRSLQELARRQGATLYMALLAALQALLSRWSGQKDIVVGTPIPGRTRREAEGLIGLFVSSLPMRADLSGEPTFEELLDQVKETTLGAFAHQELPFAKLVEQLQPARYLSRLPIFQVIFVLYHEPQEALQLPGLKLRGLGGAPVMAKFDLTLGLVETPAGLRGAFQYATDLFDRGTIERLASNFDTLLEGIVADPGRRCAERSQ
jgi:non-ribosomal peptide synthetase component F